MYSPIDDQQKQHLLKLIDFLYHEVMSSGGDGDAMWYSRFYDIKDILPLVEEYNSKLNFWEVKLEDKHIWWGHNQEGIIITNDEQWYKDSPSWQQILIKY